MSNNNYGREWLESQPFYHNLVVRACCGTFGTVQETGKFRELVSEENEKVNKQASDLIDQKFDSLALEQILTGLLGDEEKLESFGNSQAGFWIKYNKIDITTIQEDGLPNPLAPKEYMKAGYLVLTNRKLIIIAHGKGEIHEVEYHSVQTSDQVETQIKNNIPAPELPNPSKNGSNEKRIKYITFVHDKHETVEYFPIPLNHLVNATFVATVTSAVKTAIWDDYSKYGCYGICTYCCCCCCPIEWEKNVPWTSSSHDRRISVATLLPPWNKKTNLDIHVNENVPLTLMKDFVASLTTLTHDFNRAGMSPILPHMK